MRQMQRASSKLQCHSEKYKCAGYYKEDHLIYQGNCHNKISARQKMTIRKREASAYFNE